MVSSTFPDVEIPAVPVHEYLFGDLAEHDLDRVALIDGMSGAETTYRQLVGQIDLFAGALAARGIGVGDAVGLLCPNVPAFATVFHGILRAGATATTINALYTAEEIAGQLRDASAFWLITVSALLPQAQAAADELGLPADQLIVLDGARGPPVAARPALRGPPRARGDVRPGHACGGAAVLLRYDRAPQGRHAHAPEPRRQRRAERGVDPPQRRRPRARGAALLPHLRHDRAAEPRRAPARHPRHDAEVRPCRVPAHRRRAAHQLAVHRSADRRRPRQASARRPVRHERGQGRVLGSSSPRRSARRRCRRAAGLHRAAGLRHDRDQPGHALDPGGPRRHRPLLHRPAAGEHRGAAARRGRIRHCRSCRWPERAGRAADPRAAGHEGVSEPPRRDRRHARRRRLAAHRAMSRR